MTSKTTDFSPLRYRPDDPHMGLWAWDMEPDEQERYRLIEDPQDCYAMIAQGPDGQWTTMLADYTRGWLENASREAADLVAELTGRSHATGREAAECAERAVAALAIDLGLTPDPAQIPVVFLLGKTRTSLHYLNHLEWTAREELPNAHRPGSIARLKGDPHDTETNPVAQARAIHQMMCMPKGHWPPRTDIIDDCIDLDSRYAAEHLDRGLMLSFRMPD